MRPLYNTESHPFLHLMGQGPLTLICLYAPAVHAPHSHGSISVPLLPLPKHCNKSHPDAAAPRCVPPVGSWSSDLKIIPNVGPAIDSIPDRPARSQSLYRLSYPTHKYYVCIFYNLRTKRCIYTAFECNYIITYIYIYSLRWLSRS